MVQDVFVSLNLAYLTCSLKYRVLLNIRGVVRVQYLFELILDSLDEVPYTPGMFGLRGSYTPCTGCIVSLTLLLATTFKQLKYVRIGRHDLMDIEIRNYCLCPLDLYFADALTIHIVKNGLQKDSTRLTGVLRFLRGGERHHSCPPLGRLSVRRPGVLMLLVVLLLLMVGVMRGGAHVWRLVAITHPHLAGAWGCVLLGILHIERTPSGWEGEEGEEGEIKVLVSADASYK